MLSMAQCEYCLLFHFRAYHAQHSLMLILPFVLFQCIPCLAQLNVDTVLCSVSGHTMLSMAVSSRLWSPLMCLGPTTTSTWRMVMSCLVSSTKPTLQNVSVCVCVSVCVLVHVCVCVYVCYTGKEFQM